MLVIPHEMRECSALGMVRVGRRASKAGRDELRRAPILTSHRTKDQVEAEVE